MRHSNNTVRSSVVKYLFCSCVLYLFVNALIFSASPNSMTLCYISIGLSCFAFVLCIFFWIRWKLATNPVIGNNFDEEQLLAHKERFDLNKLAENYRHPLQMLFPSPDARTRGKRGKKESKEDEAEKVGDGMGGDIEISIDENKIKREEAQVVVQGEIVVEERDDDVKETPTEHTEDK